VSALARVREIAERHGLRVDYPRAVHDEVAALAAAPGIADPTLADLTELPFITIDYEHSRDLDQAMFIRRRTGAAGGGHELFYALADAAHFVALDSALFEEALARGASYYLPGLTLPMLPAALSEDLVSLNEGVERRASVFRIVLDDDGVVIDTGVVRARIRSLRKLTYSGVQRHHDDGWLAGHDFTETLDLLAEVGGRRIQRARERDVVRYDRVAIDLGVSKDGEVITIAGEPRSDVQRWNEQVSLVCNIQGARLLAGRGIFRVHPAPEPAKLDDLGESIDELVVALELDPELWRWHRDRDESLADYIDRLPDGRLSRALQRQAMLINETSTFEVEPGPHYGVGAPAYARFSSPMREIVGVVTTHMAFGAEPDPELLARVVAAGNTSKALQKRVTKAANAVSIDQLFSRDLELAEDRRPARTGTIMGVSATRVYVQLDDPPIEVKLYGDYELVNRFIALRGSRQLRVGAPVDVVARAYDDKRRRWLLSPVATETD